MLTWLFALSDELSIFNVFRYITFRTGAAMLTALLLVFLFGPAIIRSLRIRQGKGQPIRTEGPANHLLEKQGTPTMGGLMILFGATASILLWCDLANAYVWVVLLLTLVYGGVGLYDDYLKVTRQTTAGFRGRIKLVIEGIAALLAAGAISYLAEPSLTNEVAIPFLKDVTVDLGWLYIPFGAFIIVGAGNAVNLTDGLDGLAIVPVMIASATFGFIAYLVGNAVFAEYLQIHFVLGSGELAVLCGALVGAGLGFLWFNAPPAQIFMGDTGSLALGGAIGTVAVAIKHEIVLAVVGGLFVLEAVSVIVQVTSYKLTGHRVFRMAPLHHHFEQKGWKESTIVIRFWIIAVVLAMAGLATLKLR
ncbi:phospho-N-acetylmuramoyl-pentapeptide-transferase [Methyloligella solikamskensis]|uniref:Phospho-N-acetylmuramoyl-pentapeptide-transferase n=1 Tax=Methyloligella solikamskensis TaxID=1177756 RepID=A0ABW3JBV9_9HYPH